MSKNTLKELLSPVAKEIGLDIEDVLSGEVRAIEALMGELEYFDGFERVASEGDGAGEKYQTETVLFRSVPHDIYFTMSRTYSGSHFTEYHTSDVTAPAVVEPEIVVHRVIGGVIVDTLAPSERLTSEIEYEFSMQEA